MKILPKPEKSIQNGFRSGIYDEAIAKSLKCFVAACTYKLFESFASYLYCVAAVFFLECLYRSSFLDTVNFWTGIKEILPIFLDTVNFWTGIKEILPVERCEYS